MDNIQNYPFQDPIDSNGCLYHMFATPVFSCICNNIENIQKELEVSYRKSVFEYKKEFGMTHQLSDTSFHGNVIIEDNLKELERAIYFNLTNYLQSIGFEHNNNYVPNMRCQIQQSWWSKFGYRDYAHQHNHGESDVAGVYYFKATSPSNKEGNIYFRTPVRSTSSSFVFNHYGNGQVQEAEVGKMLLFPGYLDHGVTTNETNTDRVSLSFNINFEDKKRLEKSLSPI